jgi:hypothetical protein
MAECLFHECSDSIPTAARLDSLSSAAAFNIDRL